MSMEEMIRQIVREENEKHLQDIKRLLESYSLNDEPKTISVKEAAKILGFGCWRFTRATGCWAWAG